MKKPQPQGKPSFPPRRMALLQVCAPVLLRRVLRAAVGMMPRERAEQIEVDGM